MMTAFARAGLKGLAQQRRAHQHARFLIPFGRQLRGVPRFVFVAPDFAGPAGGVRVIYDHVDALNAAGVDAVVMHQKAPFRCSWFGNSTEVTHADTDAIAVDDVLVVPELFVDVLEQRSITHPHIVLNQSGHLTWSINGDDVDDHLRRRAGLLGVVAVSEHIGQYLRYAYPDIEVEVVRNALDRNLFRPAVGSRQPVIAFLDRRDTGDVHQVLRILGARGALAGWEVRAIPVSDQRHFADELRAAQIFVSTPYQEGFGMPALEAMACGLYVIGYHGYGGREYYRPEFSASVDTGDVLGLATTLGRVLARVEEDPQWCISRGMQASRYVSGYYSIENSGRDAVTAYRRLLAQGAQP